MGINYDAIAFILKYCYFKRPGIAIFADFIKIVTFFIKQSLKTQEKLKELKILYQNAIYT